MELDLEVEMHVMQAVDASLAKLSPEAAVRVAEWARDRASARKPKLEDKFDEIMRTALAMVQSGSAVATECEECGDRPAMPGALHCAACLPIPFQRGD